jgi:hypothetical protein
MGQSCSVAALYREEHTAYAMLRRRGKCSMRGIKANSSTPRKDFLRQYGSFLTRRQGAHFAVVRRTRTHVNILKPVPNLVLTDVDSCKQQASQRGRPLPTTPSRCCCGIDVSRQHRFGGTKSGVAAGNHLTFLLLATS